MDSVAAAAAAAASIGTQAKRGRPSSSQMLLMVPSLALMLLLLPLAQPVSASVSPAQQSASAIDLSSVLLEQQRTQERQLQAQLQNSHLIAALPSFAPTRRPAPLASLAMRTGSGLQAAGSSFYEPAVQRGPVAQDSMVSASADGGGQFGGQAAAAAPRVKFSRTNELDAFLDEMNHNELRTVAAGRPIDDLFMPKAAGPSPSQGQGHGAPQQPASASAAKASGGGGGLMGSHSEQQIYSECALILQRTYVKNIDEPK